MTRGLLLVADGVSDAHLEYAYHRLREDAVLVDVAAPGGGSIRTAAGQSWDAVAIDDLGPDRRYDLIVVPGGDSAVRSGADRPTRDRLAAHLEAGGVVGAIAEGIGVLLDIGVLDGRLVAAPDTLRQELRDAGAEPTDEAVTVDGSIVTARDTAALPFGVAAVLGSVVITQDAADSARERPFWGRPE